MTDFTWSLDDNRCFGCGDNPWGLRLNFNIKDEWVVADPILDEKYQGFEEIAHGGIVSTLLDEAASWAVILQRKVYGPSYHLECQFRNPVPINTQLIVRGQSQEERHGIVRARSEVLDGQSNRLAWGNIKCKIRHTLDPEEYERIV